MAKEPKQPKPAKAAEIPVASSASVGAMPVSIPEAPAPRIDGLAAPAAAPASPRLSQAEPAKDKILIFEREGGGIDLASMREKNRDKLTAWVRKTPELFPAAVSGQPMAAAIPDEAISVLFNLVGIGETILASQKFPPEIAAAVFMWNRKQIDAIREPAKNLAAKYLPAMDAWKEEVAFVSVFVEIHFEKLAVLRQLMAEHTAAVLAAKVTPGPQPGDNHGGRMPGDISPADPIVKPS